MANETNGGGAQVPCISLLAVGTRIRFRRQLWVPACEDHPTLICAEKGEQGTILRSGGEQPWVYSVRTDHNENPFGAAPEEIEAVTANNALCVKETK